MHNDHKELHAFASFVLVQYNEMQLIVMNNDLDQACWGKKYIAHTSQFFYIHEDCNLGGAKAFFFQIGTTIYHANK
jgi:hypothetical protein